MGRGQNTKPENVNYRGPTRSDLQRQVENRPTLDNLCVAFPEDIYSRPESCGQIDSAAIQSMRLAQNSPEALVTIYRAAPTHVDTIKPGDWVTINYRYALMHKEYVLDKHLAGGGKVIKK